MNKCLVLFVEGQTEIEFLPKLVHALDIALISEKVEKNLDLLYQELGVQRSKIATTPFL